MIPKKKEIMSLLVFNLYRVKVKSRAFPIVGQVIRYWEMDIIIS